MNELSIMNICKVSIIGAGTMGRGIAQLLIENSFQVCLFDKNKHVLASSLTEIKKRLLKSQQKNPTQTKKSVHEMLFVSNNIEEASKNELIIEAVSEKIRIKKEIISQIDRFAPKEAIICSNTSSLDIDIISSDTSRSSKIIGLHFFNPPTIMPLVEITRGTQTSDKTFEVVRLFSERLGKIFINVKNSPGFVVNRILFTMINEAIRALEQGVAKAEDIDRAMVLGARHPIGPLSLADFVGLDVTLDILEALEKDLSNPVYKPSELLRKKVTRGNLGRKSGQGFFSYD